MTRLRLFSRVVFLAVRKAPLNRRHHSAYRLVREVRVALRRLCLCMTERFADLKKARTVCGGEGRERMPKIVHANIQ